jgi:hypothetical protein
MVCTSLEDAHAAVVQLVQDFADNEAHYLSPNYSEAQARLSFIDKLWQALGWDVSHELQKNPYAQEVKVEDPQKILGSQRRADYAFHTAPNFRDARFFCEAKKPAVQLLTDKDAAFQTLRYGWSAGTPLAVLTDFEQFVILDCRAKPDIDTALARSHRYFHYKDWRTFDKFAELYYLFSREAFRDGGFDAYVSKLPRPKKVGKQLGLLRTGTQPVDTAFLIDLEGYRETLAKLLKAADHSLDGDALTELVQRILDRLVFLRFLEDKLIETEVQVHQFSRAAGGHSWAKFLAASRRLDARYNGIVFKLHPILDTPGRLAVDDARFADLCEDLSHTKSPYDFNAIPIHILGSIYERFLGKVIVTTAERARVEEKPEVRKSGGVYYTPEHIVRYVCEQTIGRMIDGKSPAQIAKQRFADIACGSGSFLLGVYDLLIRAHGLWYNAHPTEAREENLAPPEKSKKRKKEFVPAVVERDGVLRLTLEKKREILLNNIFGVDLDAQAVEVAQLSLYLKLLEDETTASAAQHYLDFHEAVLPSLANNVKCGNSLVGPDLFDELDWFELSPQKRREFNAFAIRREFQIEDDLHGFDGIVGNPPWGQKEIVKDSRLKAYMRDRFPSATGIFDLFRVFVDQGLRLTKPGGAWGMVLPDIVLLKDYQPTRELLLRDVAITNIDWWGMAFEDATIDAVTIVGTRGTPTANQMVRIKIHDESDPLEHSLPQSDFSRNRRSTFNLRLTPEVRKELDRFNDAPKLGEYFEIHEGVHSGNIRDELFVRSAVDETCTPMIFGRDELMAFHVRWHGQYIRLSALPAGRTPEKYANAGRPEWYQQEKVLVRRTGDRVIAAVERNRRYASNNFFILFPTRPSSLSLSGLAALLNSNLITWFFRAIEPRKGRVFAEIKIKHLEVLPLPAAVEETGRCERLNHLGAQLEALAEEQNRELLVAEVSPYDRQVVHLRDEVERELQRLFQLPVPYLNLK